jgi:release factor glutamine methyltransferase
LLEHGFAQGAAVRRLLSAHGYRDVGTVRDLAGRERVSRAGVAPRRSPPPTCDSCGGRAS